MVVVKTTKQIKTLQTISFKTKLFKIGPWTILRLPDSASAKLPSRGQVMVDGTINGTALKTPLEPDGNWSHWFKIDSGIQKAANIHAGDTVSLSISVTRDWPEPDVPAELMKALKSDATVYQLWQRITPMARWEWIRWIRSTNSTETYNRRIEVACSKLRSGERRPCCWNRNLSTDPSVSKNGVLLTPKPGTE